MITINKQKINSILVSLYLLIGQVCSIVNDLIKIDNFSVILACIISVIFCLNNRKIIFRKRSILFFIIVYVWLFYSSIISGYQWMSDAFIYFTLFGSVAFLLSSTDNIDFGSVIKNSIYISVIRVLFYIIFEMERLGMLAHAIDNKTDWSYDSIQMKIAFEFMQIAILAMVFLANRDRNRYSLWDYINALYVFVISLKVVLLDCYTRGAIVGILGTVVLIFFWKRKKKENLMWITFAMGIFVIVYQNIEFILMHINVFFISKGIDIRLITKTLLLLAKGDATQHRWDLYLKGIDIFKINPLLGMGIGYYEKITGFAYVHNIVLQVMCEFGLIGLSFILFLYIKNFKIFIIKQYSDSALFLTSIFLMSFFSLLTSGTFWKTPIFWIYIFFMLNVSKRICVT